MKSVKQSIMIFISFIMAALLCVNVFADAETKGKELVLDADMISIINGQLTDTEISAFKASGIPELASDGQFRSESPVLKIYNELFTPKVGESLEMRLAEAEALKGKASYTDYVILNATPFRVRMMNNDINKSVSIDKECYASAIPTYISDIMALSENAFTEKDCALEGIYCFDADTSHQGIAVYLKTNKGVYVRYYENSASEAILFTEDAFRLKAVAYYNYLTSHENNYNKNGEALGDGSISFLSFTQTPTHNIAKANIYKGIGIIAFVVLLIAGIVIFAKIKAKKRYSSTKPQKSAVEEFVEK